MYYKFVEEWAAFNNKYEGKPCIINVTTEGSTSNLGHIENGEIDFAIIQNDIGHHAYYGLRGKKENISFKGLKPLFKEYVQIVSAGDGDQIMRTISDLNGRRIAAGSVGSGGYWNAVDLLAAGGMKEGFEFAFVFSDLHPLESLLKGEADAAIYTSASPHNIFFQNSEKKLNVLAVPVAVVKKLSVAMRKPYYDHGLLSIRRNDEVIKIPTISVISYLVVSDSIEDKTVYKILESISEFTEYITDKNIFNGEVTLAARNFADFPFDMHHLENKNSKDKLAIAVFANSPKEWLEILFYGVIVMLLFGWLESRQIAKYDSLGVIKTSVYSNRLWAAFLILSRYAIGFILWIIWIQFVATVIMWREDLFAFERGIESPLDGFGVWDRTLWLIKIAFTNLPGEIPLSPLSAMLIPMVPLFGLGVFLLLAYKIVTIHQQKKVDRMRGSFVKNKLEEHVLICGWNSSAPGIIYSLTSKYAPKIRRVVVVADMDGDTPLSEYNFHPKLVFYIRGDSACMETLRKARAEYASEALVLAGDKKVESKNIGSILTVLALRKLTAARNLEMKTRLFIGVELRHIENMNSFLRAGADEIVDTQLLSDHVAALSLLGHEVPDYIVDFLTYDKYYELYSDKVLGLSRKIKSSCMESTKSGQLVDGAYDYNDLELQLMKRGISLFGITRNVDESDYDTAIFKSETNKGTLPIYDTDRLVYFSDSKSDIRRKSDGVCDLSSNEYLPVIGELELEHEIIIIGEEERINKIKELLKGKFTSVKSVPLGEFKKLIAEKSQRERLKILSRKLGDVHSALVLHETNDADKKTKSVLNDYSDTTSLLIIEELNYLRKEFGLAMNIIAEMEDYKSREIFIASGADQVIPRRIFLERILAKMVFNHGRMYEFLLKLITIDDGTYLRAYKVKEEDYFVGRNIKELMLGCAPNYKICGWLPLKHLSYMENKTMGFGYHFITAFNNRRINRSIGSANVEVGDTLIILYFETYR